MGLLLRFRDFWKLGAFCVVNEDITRVNLKLILLLDIAVYGFNTNNCIKSSHCIVIWDCHECHLDVLFLFYSFKRTRHFYETVLSHFKWRIFDVDERIFYMGYSMLVYPLNFRGSFVSNQFLYAMCRCIMVIIYIALRFDRRLIVLEILI